MKPRMLLTLIALTILFAPGCGTEAVIRKTNGADLVAKIKSGTKDSVLIQTHDGVKAIPRSEITDIDHPGNVAATIGTILLVYGALNIAVGLPECEKQGDAFCVGVFTPLAVAVPLSIYGYWVWGSSRGAVTETKGTIIGPTVVKADDRTYYGLTYTGRF
jgi:hypothetical protein